MFKTASYHFVHENSYTHNLPKDPNKAFQLEVRIEAALVKAKPKVGGKLVVDRRTVYYEVNGQTIYLLAIN